MKKIQFHKTSNIFINTGIVSLYHYLKKFKRKNDVDFNFELQSDRLFLETDDVLPLLEEVYYFMGKEIYDTSSKKQLDEMGNVYYDVKKDKFHRFPKMYSYGLAGVLTNNAQGTTKLKKNSPKIKNLDKDQPKIAEKIRDYFNNSDLKLLSKVYLNEPYTKITTLGLKEKYWKEGKFNCPITSENYKALVRGVNISPFIKGLSSFNSHLSSTDIKVSQKAVYLMRFSPVYAMYTYFDGYDSFISTFFNSDSLTNIYNLYNNDFFYDNDVMKAWKLPFKRNVKLHNFRYAKKNDENYSIDSGEDSYSAQEITFLILLTFYKRKFSEKFDEDKSSSNELNDLMGKLDLESNPLSLVTFKADKFASTLRPNFYEEYTNAKFIIQLIHKLETNKEKRVPIKELWRGLVFKTQKSESIQDYSKKMRLQRQIRIDVMDHILTGKSILKIIETLFHKSFLLLTNNDNPGFRRYDLILEFLKIYQSTLKLMEQSLQERAISLGKSIGYAILNHENPKNENEKKANAKNGRKYLIGLHKARTIEQFRDTLIRIQRKYQVSIANEILESLNEKNYIAIKQYAQIGALNSINVVLSNQNQD